MTGTEKTFTNNSTRIVEFDDADNFIDSVYRMTLNDEVSESTDPFNSPVDEIKTYSGMSTSFKKSAGGRIAKARKSIDNSASSKQIDEYRYDGYDYFGVVEPPHHIDTLIEVYNINEPHYAAVNAKVANIVGLGYTLIDTNKTKRALEEKEDSSDEDQTNKFRRKLQKLRDDLEEEIEGWNDEQAFIEILINVWRDYEVTGNGYFEIGRRRDGSIGYFGHIPSKTIRIRKDRDGFVQIADNRAVFFANYGDRNVSNPISDEDYNEVLHIKKTSPANTYYGIPDIVSADRAVAGMELAKQYNLDYFQNKAVPRHVITLKGAQLGPNALNELLSFFETGLKGQNHRSIFIPLPADAEGKKVEFKIEAVEASIQDSSFNSYDKNNTDKILMVHRVPISKVSAGANISLALAKDADKTFKEQVCGPEQKILEKKLNRVFKDVTDAFKIKLVEMTLTDEDTQSKIDERYRKMGAVTANEIRANQGKTSVEGGDELFDLNQKKKENSVLTEETTIRQRDADASANATDSAGEARNPKGEGRTGS